MTYSLTDLLTRVKSRDASASKKQKITLRSQDITTRNKDITARNLVTDERKNGIRVYL